MRLIVLLYKTLELIRSFVALFTDRVREKETADVKKANSARKRAARRDVGHGVRKPHEFDRKEP